MVNANYSFLKFYLQTKGIDHNEDGNRLFLSWKFNDSSRAFCSGWSIFVSDYSTTLSYSIPRSMDSEAIQDIWSQSVSCYYIGNVELCTTKSGLLQLRIRLQFTERPSVEMMDKKISTMSEAIYSLMSRYETAKNLEESFTNYGRTEFIELNLEDTSSVEESAGDGETLDLSSMFAPKFKKSFSSPLPVKGEKTGFSAVAGMDSLKEEIDEKVLWMLNHKTLAAEYKIEQPSGMLLYGPPGCGKTYIAEKFAEESGMKYMIVKPSDLADRYVHGTSALISQLFDNARENAPCVICFDEFDAMVPRRDSKESEYRSNEINEFLTQMNNAGAKGIFVIGTTNNREAIDPAILRSGRMDIQVEVQAPDEKAREALFRYHLSGRPLDAEIDYETLSSMTRGYASSDIVSIVRTAAVKAARQEALIGQEHLENAIRSTKSSLDNVTRQAPKIGFKPAIMARS